MSETVKRWDAPRGTTISAAEHGEFVHVADYERLEQECERLRGEQGAETFLTLTEEIVKAKAERDAALKLLSECQEHLDPHRDAVLWGDVVEALRCAPTK